MTNDRGSPKAVEAASKLTPCLARFEAALAGSHSKESDMSVFTCWRVLFQWFVGVVKGFSSGGGGVVLRLD